MPRLDIKCLDLSDIGVLGRSHIRLITFDTKLFLGSHEKLDQTPCFISLASRTAQFLGFLFEMRLFKQELDSSFRHKVVNELK